MQDVLLQLAFHERSKMTFFFVMGDGGGLSTKEKPLYYFLHENLHNYFFVNIYMNIIVLNSLVLL